MQQNNTCMLCGYRNETINSNIKVMQQIDAKRI